MQLYILSLLGIASFVCAAPLQNIQASSRIDETGVSGKAFDRFAVIFLENIDFSDAANNEDIKFLSSRGITLTNYYGLTHPSQPNYIASVAGDFFGLSDDNDTDLPANISTIVDLLEDRGVSWAEYQEDIPSTGFQGSETENENGDTQYVRKHNPLVSFTSVTSKLERLGKIQSFEDFRDSLKANSLPQWMFITPNMTNDGHDSNMETAGSFSRRFLEPLLLNPNFMHNTLVLLTFDENDSYIDQNKVYALLLGDAIPAELRGTQDESFYNHYSQLSTVEANWGLSTLGRFDVGANVFKVVADKTGDVIADWPATPPFTSMLFNFSYPGFLNILFWQNLAAPNIDIVKNARSVLPAIKSLWGSQQTYYTSSVVIPDGLHPPDQ